MRTRFIVYALLALLATGCAGQRSAVPMPGQAGPDIKQSGTGHWVQLTPHVGSTIFRGIAAGSDGNMWFTNQAQLIRLSMAGGAHVFNLTFSEGGTTYSFGPIWLNTGADGKLYINCNNCVDPVVGGGIIGVFATNKFVMHRIPSKDIVGNNGFGVGPDGNTWFGEEGHIARITPAGTIAEYSYTSGETMNTGSTPVAGPDGNVWFTDYFKQKVGKINPTTHTVTEFDVSGECSGPQGLAVGTDNKLYFNCSSGSLASITTAGALGPAIANPYGTSNEPGDMVTGPNHHIWFATTTTTFGEYNESSGTLITHSPPFTSGDVLGLADGPDTNVWGANNAGFIDTYVLAVLNVTPKSLTFTGTGQMKALTATYNGTGTLSASSADTTIATVAPGGTAGTYVVTSQGAGRTKITIVDGLGNLFIISVTVT